MVVAACFCLNAMAQNWVTMDNFSIKLGETKAVAVYLNNSDPVGSLQMDIEIPDGVTVDPASVTRNENRVGMSTHSILMNKVSGTSNTYRLVIVPSRPANEIKGDSGPVVYFNVTNKNLTKREYIYLSNIVASNNEKDPDTGLSTKLDITGPEDDILVVPYVGHFYFDAESLSIKTDGSTKTVNVGLRNHIAVRGFQGSVTLPEGMSFVLDGDGYPTVSPNYERLQLQAAINTTLSNNGQTMNFVASSLTQETIKGDSGVVFSFPVMAAEGLAESSNISLNKAVVSDEQSVSFDVVEEAGMKVINSYLAYFTPANDSVQGLRDRYAAAVEKIDTEAAAVKDSALVVDGKAAIEKDIEALAGAVEAAYNDETLAANFDAILAPVVEIDEAIVALVDTALAYQQTLSANEAAYGRLQADIEALQTQLDEAKAQLEAECPDVAAWFTDSIADIQADIDSVSNEVKALYDAMKLTEESTIDGTQIVAAIETLVADAIKAQTESTLNAYYATANDSIIGLRGRYDAAVEKIAAEAAAVKDSAIVTEAMAAIVADMDALQKSVDDAYNEATLVENFAALLEPVVGIDTAIVAMVDEALAFGQKVVANNEAYTRLTADIAALQAKLDAAEAQIAEECPNVGALFADSIEAIQADIDTITAEVKAQYEAIELTAESAIDGAAIEAAITEVVEVALEAEQTMSANEAAYQRLTADIAALQAKLDAAETQITTECADVAANYAETIEGLQADIDSITAEVKAQYEATELTAESAIDGAAIEAAISEMVEAAVAAQKAITDNNEAYTRLTADIAALQAKLDAAETQISDECADVAANYAETIEGLQADIDSITAEVKAQYEATELTAESAIDGAAIEAAISEMVEAAVAAQEAYEANEEAYARLSEDIAELQAKLDAAEEQIAEECPDVADRFTETLEGLQADIDSISEEVEAQYEAIELTAESAIDGTEIEAAIEKAIEDAIEAQKEFSGIDSVLMDVENGKAKIYSISGQLLDAPVKGQVNIFKYTDGRVVKFYMK